MCTSSIILIIATVVLFLFTVAVSICDYQTWRWNKDMQDRFDKEYDKLNSLTRK